jgi:hypothetical protein
MMFMFLFLMLIPYLAIGLVTERNRYALAAHNAASIEQNADYWEQHYNDASSARDLLVHGDYCFHTSIRKSYDCQNCKAETTRQWTTLTAKMKLAKEKSKTAPKAELNPTVIVGWPLYATTIWLKSGTVKPSDVELSNEARLAVLEKEIAKAEIAAGIEPLRQLE